MKNKTMVDEVEHRLTFFLPAGLTPSEREAIFDKVRLLIKEAREQERKFIGELKRKAYQQGFHEGKINAL